jgi:D-sedoheptulose 7-phosphate isomerase
VDNPADRGSGKPSDIIRRMLEQRVQQQFFESADLLYQAAETLARPIADAAQAVVSCLTGGGKLLICGSGPAAADAMHVAAQLCGRFERERPGLPAIALTADVAVLSTIALDDLGQVYAKQVFALGAPGDVLVVLGSHAGSSTLPAAVEAAHAKDMSVIALTPQGGAGLAALLSDTDVHINVPHERAVRVQEVHLLALHCIADAVDLQLLGEQDTE